MAKLEDLIKQLAEQIMLHRSCLSCDHFTETTEQCAKAGMRPPARTIAQGCPAYDEAPPM